MTSSNTSVKESLLKRLAVLLNVGDEDNDYVTDVLDQLIEIGEDVDDVASYLTSFLGGDDDGDVDNHLAQFANDVRRFKLGEEIVIETVGSSPLKSDAAVLQQPPQEKDRTHQRQLQQQRKEEEELKKQKPVRQQLSDKPVSASAPAKKVTQSFDTKEKQKKDNGGSSKQTNKAYSSTTTATTKKDTSKQQISKSKSPTTKQKQPPLPPKELKKGKAKRICGCYGTKHNPLTNCLHCGRISCEAEGYDFCPFCHILIEDFSQRIQGERSSSSAMLHKERLLEFDRSAAARTHILDDQEDYFVSSNSMWSTQEEQDQAGEKEINRRKLLHERQKQKLTINF
eukprot:CAMPEP_0113409400 /NCGR_PEP_ID=MMETSP0013_2-20120614/21125_1 /TAXON_ID=2843 ORGANISM="Skeletonema costatum, Strain 1716" /NCGR_SAMPLE_ID=MMETSP0013_2 /ASSEMBLY_ACC=CAM_ASM_000158 /LENGTH=339 /DNA_ID=CAMNT_0000295511 /DNA_START=13 /DNA_END=1032 /DNA_ORIENTATION=- /assembly_acc=CAM_ASM_000158